MIEAITRTRLLARSRPTEAAHPPSSVRILVRHLGLGPAAAPTRLEAYLWAVCDRQTSHLRLERSGPPPPFIEIAILLGKIPT